MKKFIITSACTLVLSLVGAMGSSHNSFNLDQYLNSKTNTTQVVENVTNNIETQSLASNDQSTVTSKVTEATNIETEVTPVNTNDTNKPETGVLSATVTSKTYVYKSVDLSNCKTVGQVVKVLRSHGYTNVTKKNIYKNKSLKKILASIKANNAKSTAATKATTPTTNTTTQTTNTATTPTKTTTTNTTTTTPTKATTSTSSNTATSSYAKEVIRLVNVERAKAGLSALTTTSPLSSAANLRAKETVQSFSHTRPNGQGFSTALTQYGVSFSAAGENIAWGQKTPQEVVTAWMNSPGHRANILNANFGKIGVGVYQSNGVYYWTQEFTN